MIKICIIFCSSKYIIHIYTHVQNNYLFLENSFVYQINLNSITKEWNFYFFYLNFTENGKNVYIFSFWNSNFLLRIFYFKRKIKKKLMRKKLKKLRLLFNFNKYFFCIS